MSRTPHQFEPHELRIIGYAIVSNLPRIASFFANSDDPRVFPRSFEDGKEIIDLLADEIAKTRAPNPQTEKDITQ